MANLIAKTYQNPSVCFADISLWKRETIHRRLAPQADQLS